MFSPPSAQGLLLSLSGVLILSSIRVAWHFWGKRPDSTSRRPLGKLQEPLGVAILFGLLFAMISVYLLSATEAFYFNFSKEGNFALAILGYALWGAYCYLTFWIFTRLWRLTNK